MYVHKYSIVPVKIHYQGHPLILGTDWAGFNQVTKELVGVRS